MKLYRLDKSGEAIFQDLDPLMMLPRGNFGYSVSIGAFEKDETTGCDVPAGLMVFTRRIDTLLIEWLYVAPQFRCKGIACELIEYALRFAIKDGIRKIGAYFYDDPLRKELCPNEKDFFKDKGFTDSGKCGGEWFTDVKTILANLEESDDTEDINIISMKTMSVKRARSCIEELISDPYTAKLYSIEGLIESFEGTLVQYDEDLSFVVVDKNEKTVGGIFFENESDTLYPVCFNAHNEKTATKLMTTAMRAASKKYGQDMPVWIILYVDKYLGVMDRLIPIGKATSSIMTVDVADLLDDSLSGVSFAERNVALSSDASMLLMDDVDVCELLEEGEDVSVDLRDLSSKPLFMTNETRSDVYSLGEIDIRKVNTILADCLYHKQQGAFKTLPVRYNQKIISPDLSCVVMHDNEISSIFLVSNCVNNCIRPLVLFTKKVELSKELMTLIVEAYRKASAMCDEKDTHIVVRCHNDVSGALCKKILM